MTLTNDQNNTQTEDLGFDTNSRTREIVFSLMYDYIGRHEHHSGIPHEKLLKELAACVRNESKGNRPDHTRHGSLDCAMAWGIGLYVFQFAAHQVTCNDTARRKSVGLLQMLADRMAQPERKGKNPFS